MSVRHLMPPAVKRPAAMLYGRYRRWRVGPAQLSIDRLCESLVENPVISVPDFSGDYEFDPRSRVFQRLLIEGSYESGLIRLARSCLSTNLDVIDVGANVGFYSVALAKLIDGDRRVVAVEPSAEVLPILQRNLERNNTAGKTEVVAAALGQTYGRAQLTAIEGKSEFSTIATLAHPAAIGNSSVSHVDQITLDDLVTTRSLVPGFIKIDVEGAEMMVLSGGQNTLREHLPVVLCEVSDTLLRANGSSFCEVLNLMTDCGYVGFDAHTPALRARSKPFGDVLFVPETTVRRRYGGR